MDDWLDFYEQQEQRSLKKSSIKAKKKLSLSALKNEHLWLLGKPFFLFS